MGKQWEGERRGLEAGRPDGSLLPTMTRTPSFSFPAFELLYSHPNLFYLFLCSSLYPAGPLPSSRLCCKTWPCHLQRCLDALPQITGPARQPLGALRLRGAPEPSAKGAPHQASQPGRSCTERGSSAGSRRHPRPCLGTRTGFRYTRGNRLLPVSGRSPLPRPPGLHYYFYPGCCLRRILVSAGLAGLLGWGLGEGSWTRIRQEKKVWQGS